MKGSFIRRREGQSLVEMALTLPILILMFAGLIEVGAALRSYLIVVNANREGARYAARATWFDSSQNPTLQNAERIFNRVVAAAGIDQRNGESVQFLRPVEVDGHPANAAISVIYIEIPDQMDNTGGPLNEGYSIFGAWISGTLPSGASPIDPGPLAEAARQRTQEFNQAYKDVLTGPSEDNFIIVEVWYQHEQLLGLPPFTEFDFILPNPITLYGDTTMRVTLDSARNLSTP